MLSRWVQDTVGAGHGLCGFLAGPGVRRHQRTDGPACQPPAPDDVYDDDPREAVRIACGYLDPSHRRSGLPLTSTLMESLIKG